MWSIFLGRSHAAAGEGEDDGEGHPGATQNHPKLVLQSFIKKIAVDIIAIWWLFLAAQKLSKKRSTYTQRFRHKAQSLNCNSYHIIANMGGV